jgi:hypothetical protein
MILPGKAGGNDKCPKTPVKCVLLAVLQAKVIFHMYKVAAARKGIFMTNKQPKPRARRPKNIKKVGPVELKQLKNRANELYYTKNRADLNFQLRTAKTFDKEKPSYID